MYIALIRHGDYQILEDTPSAHQPYPLNERGLAQVEAGIELLRTQLTALSLTMEPEVHSSRMLRAWQTARGFCDAFSELEEIQSVDALAERSVGALANLSISEIERIMRLDPRIDRLPPPDWKMDSDYRLPFQGAESLMEAGARMAAHLRLHLPEHRQRIRLFFGHGGAIRHAAHHLGLLPRERLQALSVYHAHPLIFHRDEAGHWRQCAGDWKPRKRKRHTRDLD